MASIRDNDPDLQALLNWVPRRLIKVPAPEGCQSKASRKPAYYDKHISDGLVLKRVKLMNSLVHDIASNVDTILDNIHKAGEKLPPYSQRMSAEQLSEFHRSQRPGMVNELAVSELYKVTTALYCMPAASLLAFYPDIRTWTTVLYWTIAPANRQFAIADGALQFLNPSEHADDDEERQCNRTLWDSVGKDIEMRLSKVRERFPDLAIWEFKSLAAGDDEVMQGIKREAITDIPFPWNICKGANCPTVKHTMLTPPLGPDGDDHPWNFLLPDGHEGPGLNQGGNNSSETSEPDDDDDDLTYKIAKELTSQDILQQAWAEAVRADATLLIIHSGNYEYVAVRHRGTQTLFLSDIYEPHALKDPGYGKLHIGIYISAIKDALDRFKKLPTELLTSSSTLSSLLYLSSLTPVSSSSEEEDGSDKKGKGRDRGRGKGGSSRKGGASGTKGGGQGRRGGSRGRKRGGRGRGYSASRVSGNKPEMAESQFAWSIEKRRWLFMYLRFGIYDSPVPATFVRAIPPPSDNPTPSASPNESMILVLSSELAQGATGVTHGGTLEIEDPEKHISLDVVAKLAFSEDQQEDLKHEFSIYCHLASRCVKNIPTALGLFEDIEGGALALLLTHAGAPIVNKSKLSASAQLDFRSTLEEIHCAGILHGDIRLPNLLINDSGKVAIIDFGRSRENPSTKAMAREKDKLADLLD